MHLPFNTTVLIKSHGSMLVCTSPANAAQNLPKDLKGKRSQDLPMEGAAGDAHPSTMLCSSQR